jgi:hypothetical protein
MEHWKIIPDFPGYMVTELGFVYNKTTGRSLTRFTNTTSILYVGMNRDGKTVNRSVARLVANAFLDAPESEVFDTPMQLDADRTNCRASNLVWRPSWFVRRYRAQFRNNLRGFKIPVEIVETGEQFPNSWEAAIKYGLLDRDILISHMDDRKVWPVGFTFRPINNPYRLA